MHFIATLEHSPDNCWGHEEYQEKAIEFTENLDERASDHGVTLHGAYGTPNEHTFYFIFEADTAEAITEFLGPPLLQDHEGHVAPVLSLRDAVDTVLES